MAHDYEPRRAFGFRSAHGEWHPPLRPGQPPVLPEPWYRLMTPPDMRWLRHPVRWFKWRAELRRRGPYAPDFEDLVPPKVGRARPNGGPPHPTSAAQRATVDDWDQHRSIALSLLGWGGVARPGQDPYRSMPVPDTRWLRHPVRWFKWKAELRRRGPYASDFEDFEPPKKP